MKKLILNTLIDFITGNITWGVAFVLSVSNLFFDHGYIETSNNILDWVLALVSTLGVITVGVAGEDLRRKLKQVFKI